jgi:iron-sulfur cluster assembly protein
MKPMLTLTAAAREQLLRSLSQRGRHTQGIRIGVNTKGCSGHSYVLEFCEQEDPRDEKMEIDLGYHIYVDPKSLLYVLGLEIDWQKEKMKEGFVFNNPNAKGTCGCGESFHV